MAAGDLPRAGLIDRFVSVRMGAESGTVIVVRPHRAADHIWYESNALYPDERAMPLPCTGRATSYCASIAATLAVRTVKRLMLAQPVERQVDFDLGGLMFVVDAQTQSNYSLKERLTWKVNALVYSNRGDQNDVPEGMATVAGIGMKHYVEPGRSLAVTLKELGSMPEPYQVGPRERGRGHGSERTPAPAIRNRHHHKRGQGRVSTSLVPAEIRIPAGAEQSTQAGCSEADSEARRTTIVSVPISVSVSSIGRGSQRAPARRGTWLGKLSKAGSSSH